MSGNPDRLYERRREVLERRIEYLESTIPKEIYAGGGAGFAKQELSALKGLLGELDYLRKIVAQFQG
jgi:hypothetical protein